MNPFLPSQEEILHSVGEIMDVSVLVYIDLNLTLEEQFNKYSKNLKRHLKKVREACYIKRLNQNKKYKVLFRCIMKL
ncbi:hypothetical protein GCM10007028_04490 [Algibacter mikhailovii]|uniref:Uncharacterized protein n=1 Tax=Algibacter mikhailovii TaxID=425498 RepID=A0A918V5C3_9FLAO|nr:hypothetical protein GCM10007028_04490 [Algibacter mikhailovii]